MVKKKRKLSNNGRLRFAIQNEELPNAFSTRFNKMKDFKLGDLEQVIKIIENRNIPLENCKIVVQNVKIPKGKGRLFFQKILYRVITIRNNDTICLARSIVTAYTNLKPERWTKTQIQDGFNVSRKLQKVQALKLHQDADVVINDYRNDVSDVDKFAKQLNIEINIVNSEQFNEIIYTANKGCGYKIYL